MSSVKLRCIDEAETVLFQVDQMNGVYISNTRPATNASAASLVIQGGVGIDNTNNSSSITSGGCLTIGGGAAVQKDLYVGGNLYVLGTQTQVESQTVLVQDNLIVLNSTSNASRDAGVMFQRFQLENDTGVGDVVNDTPNSIQTVSSASGTQLVFQNTASSVDNVYTNWFVKVASGTGINQVRQITSYTGSSRLATLNTSWTVPPASNDTVHLYNKVGTAVFYQESSDKVVIGYTPNDPGSYPLTVGQYSDLLTGSLTLASTSNSTGMGSGGALAVHGGASFVKDSFFQTKIGIGTTSPSVALDVQGSGGIYVYTTQTSPSLHIRQDTPVDITSGTRLALQVSNSSIHTNEGVAFQIGKGSLTSESVIAKYTHTGTTSPSNFGSLGLSGQENVISWNGHQRVGINTTSPSHTLTVSGNLNITNGSLLANGSTHTLGSLYVSGANVGINTVSPTFPVDVTGSLRTSNGVYTNNVGINTTAPSYHIDVVSDTNNGIRVVGSSSALNMLSSPTSPALQLAQTTSLNLLKTTDTLRPLALGTNNLNQIIMTSNGNVGISTTNPTSALTVNGTMSSLMITSANIHIGNASIANLRTSLGTFGSLAVSSLAQLTNLAATNTSVSNLVATNFKSTSNTIGALFTVNDYVGIGITNPSYDLDVGGNGHFTGDLIVDGAISGSGSSSSTYAYLTLTATDEAINETTGALISFGGIVIQCPTDATNTQNGGSLLSVGGAAIQKRLFVGGGVVSDEGSNTIGSLITTGGNIGIGLTNPGYPLDVQGHANVRGDIYITNGSLGVGTTSPSADIHNTGTTLLASTQNAVGIGTGGSLSVLGGAAVSKDLYIGGSVYVQGQNVSLISGMTTIGSTTSTSVLTLSNIPIGRTMANTNYKILGNLSTTSTVGNVYVVSFKNQTVSTFDAVVMRIDALYSAWTDPNLKLNWVVLP
jgi:hypothetical protein